MSKKRVGIIFGGRSAEHQVSLLSAKNVMGALDRSRFDLARVGISTEGQWLYFSESVAGIFSDENDADKIQLKTSLGEPCTLSLDPRKSGTLLSLKDGRVLDKLDVVFGVLHGPFGEDGTIQGLFELIDLPYVGAGVMGSCAGLDKDVMKRLLKQSGVPITDSLCYRINERTKISYTEVSKALGNTIFVKPARMGSSVGVKKVCSESELFPALDCAFSYDDKILIERGVDGQEIECAVLGNENPQASSIGEVIPAAKYGFYSYESKYIDGDGAQLLVPARLSAELTKKAQAVAIQAFIALECCGLGRVDMFCTKSGEILLNEINTLPGFTNISMYPRLWQDAGLSYPDLITRLIDLAVERMEKRVIKVERK